MGNTKEMEEEMEEEEEEEEDEDEERTKQTQKKKMDTVKVLNVAITFGFVLQTRTHQLLIHNKELLDHIQTLVLQMQQLESKVTSAGSSALLQQNAAATLPQVDSVSSLIGAPTPSSARWTNRYGFHSPA